MLIFKKTVFIFLKLCTSDRRKHSNSHAEHKLTTTLSNVPIVWSSETS